MAKRSKKGKNEGNFFVVSTYVDQWDDERTVNMNCDGGPFPDVDTARGFVLTQAEQGNLTANDEVQLFIVEKVYQFTTKQVVEEKLVRQTKTVIE